MKKEAEKIRKKTLKSDEKKMNRMKKMKKTKKTKRMKKMKRMRKMKKMKRMRKIKRMKMWVSINKVFHRAAVEDSERHKKSFLYTQSIIH